MACMVSSTTTLVLASWSWRDFINLRICRPKNIAKTTTTGKVANIVSAIRGIEKMMMPTPPSSTINCRRNSARVTEKTPCTWVTSLVILLVSSPIRRDSRKGMPRETSFS